MLRKQPAGVVLPSAHAIDREFRVLMALKGSEVPVPQPIHYCSEREILGTPFYLMERIEGRVFQDFALPGLNPHERRDIYRSMGSTLAGIHRLDFHAIGLGDYGRPGNYFERQLKRWSQQWASFRRDDVDNPALDQLVIWLSSHVPTSELLALCHGDFRIGNLIFH